MIETEKTASVAANDLPRELRNLRSWLDLSQSEMAVAMGVSASAYITWEQGTRTPRRQLRDRVQASLARLHASPARRTNTPRLPFGADGIPECCDQPAKYTGRRYLRAKARQKWSWTFRCRKCGKGFLRDEMGSEIPALPSGNYIPLPFRRPECCHRPMKIKRVARHAKELSNRMVFFLHCVQPGCFRKGVTRKFVEEAGEAREVTKVLSRLGGTRRLDFKERPECKRCGRPLMVQGQREKNGQKQVRFGCYRHGGSRWYCLVKDSWTLLLPYKHGPYGFQRSGPIALPEKLAWNNRPKCETAGCERQGKPLRVHEFPPESKRYWYKLWCPKCRKGARWLDASLRRLRPRSAGRPLGSQQRHRVRIASRKRNFVIRDRNKLVFHAKLQQKPTTDICVLLDSKNIPLPRKWARLGYGSWHDTYEKKPRLPIRLFSVILSKLGDYKKRELDYYFA